MMKVALVTAASEVLQIPVSCNYGCTVLHVNRALSPHGPAPAAHADVFASRYADAINSLHC